MMNLIQLQDEMKNLPLADVQKYANGSNPQVPAYLALSEMMRRKQIEATQQAFQGNPPTVKDQLSNALSKPSQFAVDPTQQQGGVNPTLTKGIVNPAAQQDAAAMLRGQKMATQSGLTGEQQGQQGIADIAAFEKANPVQTFADGGIVDLTTNQLQQPQPPLDGSSQQPTSMPQQAGQPTSFWGQPQWIAPPPQPSTQQTSQAQPQALPQNVQGLSSLPTSNMFQQQSFAGGGIVAFDEGGKTPDISGSSAFGNTGGTSITTENTPSGYQAPPVSTPVTDFSTLPQARQAQISSFYNQTPEQFSAAHKARLAAEGVSEDPFLGIKDRYSKIEERQAAQAASNPLDRIIAQFSAMAQANPVMGIGYQAGVGAQASQKLEAAQNELLDKQQEKMAELQHNIAKEDDARKRGNVAAEEGYAVAKEKNVQELAKLENESTIAKAHMISALASQSQAGTAAAREGANDKALTTLMARVNGDPAIKALSGRLKDAEVGSEEYNGIVSEIQRLSVPYYKSAGLEPPELGVTTVAPKPAKTPWWKFGSSSSDNTQKVNVGAPQTPTGLPAGAKIVGYEPGTTNPVYETPDGKKFVQKQ